MNDSKSRCTNGERPKVKTSARKAVEETIVLMYKRPMTSTLLLLLLLCDR